MSRKNSPPPLDVDEYRERTQQLVEAMDETTALFGDMSNNMSRLSRCFEDFGATESRLRDARRSMEGSASVDSSQTSRAAD